jgi:hypothetical protein
MTANVYLSAKDVRQLDTAIRLLRDRHYRNFANAKDETSESAQEQYRIYEELDALRYRIAKEASN